MLVERKSCLFPKQIAMASCLVPHGDREASRWRPTTQRLSLYPLDPVRTRGSSLITRERKREMGREGALGVCSIKSALNPAPRGSTSCQRPASSPSHTTIMSSSSLPAASCPGLTSTRRRFPRLCRPEELGRVCPRGRLLWAAPGRDTGTEPPGRRGHHRSIQVRSYVVIYTFFV